MFRRWWKYLIQTWLYDLLEQNYLCARVRVSVPVPVFECDVALHETCPRLAQWPHVPFHIVMHIPIIGSNHWAWAWKIMQPVLHATMHYERMMTGNQCATYG